MYKLILGSFAMLAEKERIYLLIMKGYGDKKKLYQETYGLFNATFNVREPISKSTIIRIVQHFIDYRAYSN